MSRIDEELDRTKMTALNLEGLSIDELVRVLHALGESPEVRDKRVIDMSVRNPGTVVLVKTGWGKGACIGAGDWVLVERGR